MVENDCIFSKHNTICIINEKCSHIKKLENCEWYYPKDKTFPDRYKMYMEIICLKTQIKAIKTQNKFNWYITILATIAIIISVISLIQTS